jgi:hypothetical protein
MKETLVTLVTIMLLILPSQSISGTQKITFSENTKIQSNLQIIDILQQVDELILYEYLNGLLKFGPRYTETKNCSLAAEYIYNEFEKLGLYTYYENWKFIRYQDRNVVAMLNGTKSDAVFIICAHYDTVKKSPGANDNGAGVASMLTIAKILSNYSFNHTIKFIAFSGHEQGTFGSYANAKNAYKQNKNIIAAINLDMIGNVTKGDKTIVVSHTDRSEWMYHFFKEINQKYGKYIDLKVQPLFNYRADSQAFIDYGYDAVTLFQFEMLEYKYWHSPKDTIDKINFTYLSKVTKLVLAGIVEFAEKPIDVQVRIVTPYEGCIYFSEHFCLPLPGFNIWLSQVRGITYILKSAPVQINITTAEEISSVSFYIDDSLFARKNKPPYTVRIDKFTFPGFFTRFGKHRVKILVCTNNGKTASDEMDIFIIKL